MLQFQVGKQLIKEKSLILPSPGESFVAPYLAPNLLNQEKLILIEQMLEF